MKQLIISEQILELLTSHQRRIAGYLRTLVPNRIDAEEILQEVNLHICRHATEFEPGTDFSAWSLRIAHFCVLTWRRRRSRDRLTFDDELLERLASSAQSGMERRDRRRDALEVCLTKLSSHDQDLLAKFYKDSDLTPQGFAAQVGRSAKGIYETLDRIRVRLLECIQRTLAAEDRK
jgi:RNA polymerase sigma-70 factor (ECF subfamily)